jgi:hypothetical protein
MYGCRKGESVIFDSYYWRERDIGVPDLDAARRRLAAQAGGVSDFLLLLRSGNRVAVGVALDQFGYADAMSRFGGGNPLDDYSSEVLARAREILDRPRDRQVEAGSGEDGSDQASALNAMLNLAGPEDLERLATAIESPAGVHARSAATETAAAVLGRGVEPSSDLVAALRDVALDASIPQECRINALAAFRGLRSAAVAEAASRALDADGLVVQAHAALVLAVGHLATHRRIIESVVATWPEDAPYPAREVLSLLAMKDRG